MKQSLLFPISQLSSKADFQNAWETEGKEGEVDAKREILIIPH